MPMNSKPMRDSVSFFLILIVLLLANCGDKKVIELDHRVYNSWPVIEKESMHTELLKKYTVSMSTKVYPDHADSLICVTTYVINPGVDSGNLTFSDISLQVYEYSNYLFANISFENRCEELVRISQEDYNENDPYHPGTTAYPNYYFLSGKHIYLLSCTHTAGENAMEKVFHSVKDVISRGQNFESQTIVKLRHTGMIEIN
jgi:hypothetical protein